MTMTAGAGASSSGAATKAGISPPQVAVQLRMPLMISKITTLRHALKRREWEAMTTVDHRLQETRNRNIILTAFGLEIGLASLVSIPVRRNPCNFSSLAAAACGRPPVP